MHELSHIYMAKYYNIKIKQLKILPFGISLSFKNVYLQDPVQEIFISLAGPISNFLLICIGFIIIPYNIIDLYLANFFICTNIFLLLLNILPALPLDGGRILKGFLLILYDNKTAYKTIQITTIIVIFILICSGIYIVYLTKLNFSLLLIATFLFFNIFNERNNNNLIMMRGFIYHKEKLLNAKILKAKNLVVLHNTPAKKILKYLHYYNYHILMILDSDMKFIGYLSETQIILGLIENGSSIEVKDILEDNDG